MRPSRAPEVLEALRAEPREKYIDIAMRLNVSEMYVSLVAIQNGLRRRKFAERKNARKAD